jgi:hypothetical protein
VILDRIAPQAQPELTTPSEPAPGEAA